MCEVVLFDFGIVDVIEVVFVVFGEGKVVMLLILFMELVEVNGEVDVKIVYIFGFDRFVIKVSLGFFDNLFFGLFSFNGLMILFFVKMGLVEVLFFDNGYLIDICMVVVGVVVVWYLVFLKVIIVGVIGMGV